MTDEKYQLYLFDLDGTLARPASGETFRRADEPYVWLPYAHNLLEHLHAMHRGVAICTNQGGIAAGFLDYDETGQAIRALLSTLSFPVHFLYCPYVPDRIFSARYQRWAFWRKPSPVMLLLLAQLHPNIAPEHILCVGDLDHDKYAATNAGFAYEDIGEFLRARNLAPARQEPEEDMPF